MLSTQVLTTASDSEQIKYTADISSDILSRLQMITGYKSTIENQEIMSLHRINLHYKNGKETESSVETQSKKVGLQR